MDEQLQIINASIDVILEQGIRALSVETVSVEASLDTAIVEQHFSNTDKLLQALLVHINEKRALWMDDMVAVESSKDLFCHHYLRWVRFLSEQEHLFCILDEMPSYYGEDCNDIKPAFTLKEALRRCKDDGLILEGDIDEQLVLINTRLMGFARWIHRASFILFDVYIVSHMNAIWDLLKRK